MPLVLQSTCWRLDQVVPSGSLKVDRRSRLLQYAQVPHWNVPIATSAVCPGSKWLEVKASQRDLERLKVIDGLFGAKFLIAGSEVSRNQYLDRIPLNSLCWKLKVVIKRTDSSSSAGFLENRRSSRCRDRARLKAFLKSEQE